VTARFLALLALAAGGAQAAEPMPYEGEWHISRGIVAPWVGEEDPQPDATALLGKRVVFAKDHVEGPGVIACGNARYERDDRPLDGLFQGNLPAPVENAAGEVALVKPPIASLSVTCDNGIFDLHFATRDALLLGLDNVVWVLDRSPGAFAAAGTPEHVVQALLQDHYARGLEFTPARVAAQRAWLSDALAAKIDGYFALDVPEGDAPPINGDPFTDSQDYPPLFSVREAKVEGAAAVVPVRFDSGYESREVRYKLVQQGKTWRVDDIDYDHGTPFTELLMLTE
jgi:hypothetical protein